MRRYSPYLLAIISLSLAFAMYYPGLSGAFMFDDTVNITANANLRVTTLDFPQLKQAALSGGSGIAGRPLSYISFAVNYFYSGFSPYAFKLNNLLIHLLNGVTLFFFSRLLMTAHGRTSTRPLTDSAAMWISLSLASAWLVHPMNLTSVLYVVQRMTSLATLFILLGLISYLYGRLAMEQRISARATMAVAMSFLVFTPLAVLSKESGALLPLFLLLTELCFFRFQAPSRAARRMLLAGFGLAVALPLILVLFYTVLHPEWIGAAYAMRTFTLGERLLTEMRVMWMYIRLAFVPSISLLALHHDDFKVSTSLLAPVTTLGAVLGLIALVGAAGGCFKRHRMVSYGILLFLVGHAMESTVVGLELVHEHRNYFPLIGLLLVPLYCLFLPSAQMKSPWARPAIAIGAVLMLSAVTFIRATHWGDPAVMLSKEVNHHPGSVRSHIALANFYTAAPGPAPGITMLRYAEAYEHYVTASSLSPVDTSGLFGLISLNLKTGHPVEPSWTEVLAKRIENNPLAPSTVGTLLQLEQCAAEGNCHHSADLVEPLLLAALRNKTAPVRSRSELQFALSNLLFHGRGQHDAAVAAAYKGAELLPTDIDAQAMLMVLLSNMHKDKEARVQLARVRLLDRMHVKTSVIDQVARELDRRKNAP